jgi:hypothetical protein
MSSERSDWQSAIWKIARRLEHDDFPAAHLAQLRRLDPERADGAAFWLLVNRFAEAALDDDRAERALAVTVHGMAVAHPFHFAERVSLGTAMAAAEISEARLLRTGREQLPDEVRRLARLMGSKGDAGRFDWHDVFLLALYPDADGPRRRIAKDYYRRQYKLENPKGEAA